MCVFGLTSPSSRNNAMRRNQFLTSEILKTFLLFCATQVTFFCNTLLSLPPLYAQAVLLSCSIIVCRNVCRGQLFLSLCLLSISPYTINLLIAYDENTFFVSFFIVRLCTQICAHLVLRCAVGFYAQCTSFDFNHPCLIMNFFRHSRKSRQKNNKSVFICTSMSYWGGRN